MKIQCIECYNIVEISATEEDVSKWQNDDEVIQKAMPHVPPPEREMLISGLCGACWDDIFLDDEIYGDQ